MWGTIGIHAIADDAVAGLEASARGGDDDRPAPHRVRRDRSADRPADPAPRRSGRIWAVVATAAVGAGANLLLGGTLDLFDHPTHAPTAAFALMMSAALVWRVALWMRYRPMPAPAERDLPAVSVIMPVFNEGPLVAEAIRAVAQSRYPADRLEIIVIDDGSADDSWYHVLRAARDAGDRLRVVTLRHAVNRGKRHALYLGFSRARGDVLVTIDSDSILDPEALRSGVAPLVGDSRIGCVAGRVRVLNARQSVWTRILKCTFSLSFKFVRAYQNEFRGVFCTPGAISFYRADVVRRVAGEWVDQRFLGLPCATGEDRAMTNLFLRDGWLTAYQQDAVVHSNMPTTYAGTCRMFLRWARSNVRETIILLGFVFSRFRGEYLWSFRANMALVVFSMILTPVLVAAGAAAAAQGGLALPHVSSLFCVFALPMTMIYAANEKDADWVWILLYQVIWVWAFAWIMPYAALTLRNNGWLTRGPRRAAIATPSPAARLSNMAAA